MYCASKTTALFLLPFAFFVAFSATVMAEESESTCQASEYVGQDFFGRSITSGFGARTPFRTNNGQQASSFHRALDLNVAGNPNVSAYHGGTVTHAGPINGWGNTVIVTQGNFQVQYGHAGSLNVTVGQTIDVGTVLGNWSTCSGNCTGPHLDLIYRVMDNGSWTNIDPMIAESLIAQGLVPGSPEFNQRALEETANRCSMDPNAMSTMPNTWSETSSICDHEILTGATQQVNRSVTRRNEFVRTNMTPPPSLSQVANTPCMSRELQRITNQFAFFTQDATNQVTNLMTGPISGILSNTFGASFQSINAAAASLPRMLDFQSMASTVLGNLLQSLGGGNGFASETCGMMVDMLLNYIQCEHPLELPSLGNISGPLNNLLPQGCAGEALRGGLYALGNSSALRTFNQPVNVGNSGSFEAGSASDLNRLRGNN